MRNLVVLQVKEFLERGLDAFEIARRMNMDPGTIQLIIQMINDMLT